LLKRGVLLLQPCSESARPRAPHRRDLFEHLIVHQHATILRQSFGQSMQILNAALGRESLPLEDPGPPGSELTLHRDPSRIAGVRIARRDDRRKPSRPLHWALCTTGGVKDPRRSLTPQRVPQPRPARASSQVGLGLDECCGPSLGGAQRRAQVVGEPFRGVGALPRFLRLAAGISEPVAQGIGAAALGSQGLLARSARTSAVRRSASAARRSVSAESARFSA
jgi:hypothetical protein